MLNKSELISKCRHIQQHQSLVECTEHSSHFVQSGANRMRERMGNTSRFTLWLLGNNRSEKMRSTLTKCPLLLSIVASQPKQRVVPSSVLHPLALPHGPALHIVYSVVRHCVKTLYVVYQFCLLDTDLFLKAALVPKINIMIKKIKQNKMK